MSATITPNKSQSVYRPRDNIVSLYVGDSSSYMGLTKSYMGDNYYADGNNPAHGLPSPAGGTTTLS